jgi:hypothetical protein
VPDLRPERDKEASIVSQDEDIRRAILGDGMDLVPLGRPRVYVLIEQDVEALAGSSDGEKGWLAALSCTGSLLIGVAATWITAGELSPIKTAILTGLLVAMFVATVVFFVLWRHAKRKRASTLSQIQSRPAARVQWIEERSARSGVADDLRVEAGEASEPASAHASKGRVR